MCPDCAGAKTYADAAEVPMLDCLDCGAAWIPVAPAKLRRTAVTGACGSDDHNACAPSAEMKVSVGGFGCECECHYDWEELRDDRD